MKKLVLATACPSIMLGATAGAARPAPYPHWGARVTRAPSPLLNAVWPIAFDRTAFTATRNRTVAGRRTLLKTTYTGLP